jgi:hypothetical protein
MEYWVLGNWDSDLLEKPIGKESINEKLPY